MALNISSAIRIHDSLSVGGGIMVFLCQFPNRIDLNVGAKGTTDLSGWMGLTESSTPMLGIHFKPGEIWEPLKRLRLGASYRGEFRVKSDLDTDIDIGFTLNFRLTGHTLFVPEELTFGAAYDLTDALTLAFDMEWAHWSRMPNPYLKIIVAGLNETLPLFQDVDVMPPDPKGRNLFIPRVGAEYTTDFTENIRASWRGGYHYRRSPLPYQTGESNLLDNDRHVFSAGVGLAIESLFGHRFENPQILDFHLAYHHLVKRTHYKDAEVSPLNPGYPSIESKGFILSSAFTLTIQF